MDILKLNLETRKGERNKNGTSKSERQFFDFIISGKSLRQILKITDRDLIGVLGWGENKIFEQRQINEFIGVEKPEIKTVRTKFYVCPECGELDCGAITGKIEFTENHIIWKDFGYENNLSEPDFDIYENIGPFTFERIKYLNIFEELADEQ